MLARSVSKTKFIAEEPSRCHLARSEETGLAYLGSPKIVNALVPFKIINVYVGDIR